MTRTPFVVLLLAAGVTLAGAAEPAQTPPPEKKPTAPATAPKPATTPKKDAQPGAAAAKTQSATKPGPANAKATPPKATPPATKSPVAPSRPLAADPKDKDAEPQANTDLGAAEPQADTKPKGDPNLGMSILGNQEAPKALVIVPWKSSEIGQGMGIQTLLDDSRQPIDKDVFMRVLNYFELRTTTTPTNAHQNGAKGGKS
jgi:hypothetical protein